MYKSYLPGKASLSLACRAPQALVPWVPGALGAAPRAGELDPEALRSAGCPISGHLAAMAAAPPSPVSGALISPRRGWTRPDFFPTVSRLECLPLSRTSLHPTPRMKLAARGSNSVSAIPEAAPASWYHPFLQPLKMNQRPPPPGTLSECTGMTPTGVGQGHRLWPRGLPHHRRLPGLAPTLCAKRIAVSHHCPPDEGCRHITSLVAPSVFKSLQLE